MVTYTNFSKVSAVKDSTHCPCNPYPSGYGRKIPTKHMVKYDGRWHRIYVMCYGNSGSAYISKLGNELFLDIDTEYMFQSVTPESWKQ